jgi:hypothetical protein
LAGKLQERSVESSGKNSSSAQVRWGDPDFLHAALTNIHVRGFQ